MIFVVFDSSPLTLWINGCFYVYICCFIANFSIFHATFSGNVKRVNDDFHLQNDGLLHFHALLFGRSISVYPHVGGGFQWLHGPHHIAHVSIVLTLTDSCNLFSRLGYGRIRLAETGRGFALKPVSP